MTFNYIAPYNPTGYGVASVGYLSQLNELSSDYFVNVISDPISIDEDIYGSGTINTLLRRSNTSYSTDNSLLNYNNPSFVFWHLFDALDKTKQFTGKKALLTTFETNSLSSNEVNIGNTFDLIGTCTDWGLSVLSKYFPENKLFKIPHAFLVTENVKLSHNTVSKEDKVANWSNILKPFNLPKDIFIIGSSGKFESRKGHPELIDACLKFSKKVAPVLLVGSWNNQFIPGGQPYGFLNSLFFEPIYTANGIKLYRKDNLYIVLLPYNRHRLQLHNTLLSTHIFFSPSKGEGWDLPLFEMMSYGMPCAATLCSAHSEYCTENNVIPIKHGSLVPAFDGMFFNGSSTWYNVSSVDIVSSLMHSYELLQNNKLESICNSAKESTQGFTWQQGSRKILNLMNQI